MAWLKRRLKSRKFRRNLIIVLGMFTILNLLVFVYYQKRTYPNTRLAGGYFGSMSISKVNDPLLVAALLPENLNLIFNSKNAQISPDALGLTVDTAQIYKSAKEDRAWLPVWNFVRSHNIPLYLSIDETVFSDGLFKAVGSFQQDAADAKLTIVNGEFKVIPEIAGQKLNVTAAKQKILDTLSAGKADVNLPADVTEPVTKQDRLQTTLNSLKKQQSTEVTLNYNDKNKKLTPIEIAGLFEAGDKTFDLSDNKIRTFITKTGSEFGIGVKNINDAVTGVKDAIFNNKAITFKLTASPKVAKNFSYCVAARGVEESALSALSIKLASVYGDVRGWGLDGQVAFSKVSDGCNFTVWLAAPEQMSSFGAICDAEWSCAVTPNVVINYKRWQEASPAWTAGGGNLDDYRSMVINHETGHYLSFGHKNCPAAGEAAPVMQQQSIDLAGCKFNAWPLASELNELKTVLGI